MSGQDPGSEALRPTFALDTRGRVHLRIRRTAPPKKRPAGRVPNGELLLHTSGNTRDEAVLIALAACLHEKLRRADPDHDCGLCRSKEPT